MAPKPNQELENTIEAIANENKQVTMALTVRDVQAQVQERIQRTPSTSTVARILRRIGLDNRKSHIWAWRHNDNKTAKNE